eukprot:270394-Karenia_brevis.AAC.1
MPHAKYADSAVEEVYYHIASLVSQGRKMKKKTMLFGDFNAVVGPSRAGDDAAVIGHHGVGKRNERG